MRLRIGLALLLPVLMLAVLGPFLTPDPQLSDLSNRNAPPFSDWAHPLGADMLGRDILALLIQGLRLTIGASIISVVVAFLTGGLLGLAILAKQPQFAPIIVRTITQIMVLFWIFTMCLLLVASFTDDANSFGWGISVLNFALPLLPAILLLVLRKGAALLPEVPERTRWTGMGWRIARVLLGAQIIGPFLLIVSNLIEGLQAFIPISLYFSIALGLIIAPFTLRTTLAANQRHRAMQSLRLGAISALAWAVLGGSYLGFLGLGTSQIDPNLGGLITNDLINLTASLTTLAVLLITTVGLVLTGDGIRQARTKPKASAPN